MNILLALVIVLSLTPAFSKDVEMVVTMYAPAAGDINGGPIMASGTLVEDAPWSAACDRNLYPFGTIIDLPTWAEREGLPEYVECLDTGGSVKGQHIDVLKFTGWERGVQDKAFADDWGYQHVRVTVYKDWETYLLWTADEWENQK